MNDRYMGFWIVSLVVLVLSSPQAWAEEGEEEALGPYSDVVIAALAPVPDGLTSQVAALRALDSSPSLAVKRAEVDAAVARSGRTLSRYVPNLSAAASYTRTNPLDFDFGSGGFSVGALNEGPLSVGTCPDGSSGCIVDGGGQLVGAVAPAPFEIPVDNYKLELNLTVPFSDYALSLMPARRGARADRAAANHRRDAEAAQIAVNARLAYYDWLRSVAQVAVARSAILSAQARLEDARVALTGGLVTGADVVRLEGLVASSEIAIKRASSFESLARRNLAMVMSSTTAEFTIGEDVRSRPEDIAELGSLEELIERAVRDRAELRGLRESASSAHHAAKGASTALYPRLDGVANVTHANPNQSFFPPGPDWNTSWYLGVSLSWRLDQFLDAKNQVKELKANEDIFEAQLAALEQAVELEVRAAWEEWSRAFTAVELGGKEIAAAEQTYIQRVDLFRGGEVTSTDVIEAELQRHNATLSNANALIDLRVARAKLLRSIGSREGAAQ